MIGVIFDMDGTLLDTQRICIPAWDFAGEIQGISGVGANIEYVCGMNKAGYSGFLRKKYPTLDVDKLLADSREYITDNLVVRFKKGGKEILRFLKENRVKIGLASGSSRESVMHHLNEVNAADCFDAMVCGNEIENGKPEPDIFLKTAKLLGVCPDKCFVFEDSSNGVIAAHKAGIKCFGIPDVAPLNAKAEKTLFMKLKSMDEAIPILRKYL